MLKISKKSQAQQVRGTTVGAGCGRNWDNLCGARK